MQSKGDAPTIGLDYVYRQREQEREEKGMPILVTKEKKTKLIRAKVVHNKAWLRTRWRP